VPNPSPPEPQGRWNSLALLAITGAAALLRFAALGAEDLWFDEVFSVVLAADTPAGLISRALDDQTNPPGFYAILWVWTRIGGFDVAWMRTLPALAGVALVPATAILARTLGMRHAAALLAALLVAASPLLLAMSVELRAYSLLALATVVTATLAIRVASGTARPAHRVAFTTAAVVLVTLHLFGVLALAALLVAAAWTAPPALKPLARASLPAVVLTLSWGAAVIFLAPEAGLGGNATWVPLPGTAALLSFASQVVGTFGSSAGGIAVAVVLLVALILAARRAAGATADARSRWLLVTTALPLAVVIGLAVATGHSLWVARYLVIAVPAACLLLADAALRTPAPLRVTAVALVATWAAIAGPLAEQSRAKKPAWSLMVRALAGSGGTLVCVNEAFVSLPLEYYALAERLPLDVQGIQECVQRRSGTRIIIRPGTESSLAPLQRAGARIGEPRAMHTALPDTDLRRLAWPAR
jgi:uncharacterized membrane protein